MNGSGVTQLCMQFSVATKTNEMKKRKIEDFFHLRSSPNLRNKRIFLYIPDNKEATFTRSTQEGDVFITEKSGLKLYLRPPQVIDITFQIPSFRSSNIPIPLLKSNLQKAVRRCKLREALQSTIALLEVDQTALLRRMPIIMVEDVKLSSSLPIWIWFMIADKEYTLNSNDFDILLHSVRSITIYNEPITTDCNEQYGKHHEPKLTHEELQEHTHADILLALYYRSLYGGMSGDMKLLDSCIRQVLASPFNDLPKSIIATEFNVIDYTTIGTLGDDESRKNNVSILKEAIDYHPFPQLLGMITRKFPEMSKEEVSSLIWNTESAVNVRKEFTLRSSKIHQQSDEWRKIESYLYHLREWIIENPTRNENSSS